MPLAGALAVSGLGQEETQGCAVAELLKEGGNKEECWKAWLRKETEVLVRMQERGQGAGKPLCERGPETPLSSVFKEEEPFPGLNNGC